MHNEYDKNTPIDHVYNTDNYYKNRGDPYVHGIDINSQLEMILPMQATDINCYPVFIHWVYFISRYYRLFVAVFLHVCQCMLLYT